MGSALHHGFAVFFFEFVLGLDLVGHNLGQGKREDSLVLGQQEHDPEVAELAVNDFPLLGLPVPAVAAADAGSNLFVAEGRCALLLRCESSSADSFFVHFVEHAVLDGQLFLFDVILQLTKRDLIVIVLVHRVAKSSDALFGNLHRHRPLLQILRRARVVTRMRHFLHRDCLEGSRSSLSALIDRVNRLAVLIGLHHFAHMVKQLLLGVNWLNHRGPVRLNTLGLQSKFLSETPCEIKLQVQI